MKKMLCIVFSVLFLFSICAGASAQSEVIRNPFTENDSIDDQILDAMSEVDQSDFDAIIEAHRACYLKAGWTEKPADSFRIVRSADPDTRKLAYTDIKSASPEMKSKILAAREAIIYSCSWTNDLSGDNVVICKVNHKTKEFTIAPKFSELFPGWDVPDSGCEKSDKEISCEEVILGFTSVSRAVIDAIFRATSM